MGSADAAMQPWPARFGRLAGRLASSDDAWRSFRHPSAADPRVTASATLLGVVVGAALAIVPAPSEPMPAAPAIAAADRASMVSDVPPAAVKIVGASPRSADCAEQVWPYIERRCLTRTADQPRLASAASDDVNRSAAPSETVASKMVASETVASETFASAPAAAPSAKDMRLQIATARLSPPPSRPLDALGPDGARHRLVPAAQDWLRDPQWRGDIWVDPGMERPFAGEPRRRMGRRAYRSRHGRGWDRFFGFRF